MFDGTSGMVGSFAVINLPTGYTWSNNIVGGGWIEVVTAPPAIAATPTNITYSVSGGALTLSWPTNYLGWSLQVQTV